MGETRVPPRMVAVGVLGLNLIAHAILFMAPWAEARALTALIVVGLVPGLLLVEWLLGTRDPSFCGLERTGIGLAAGFAVLPWIVLAASYLPGGLDPTLLLLSADGLTLLLFALIWRAPQAEGVSPCRPLDRWTVAGLLILLATAGFLRFANLGHAEFQGDEAKMVVLAASVVQGHEDAIFAHRKGPVEILVPASQFALLGQITEGAARIPFALSNVLCILVVFLFGRRLHSALAGWLAAMLLAFDGYFIGYTRIVQYPGFIFLLSACTLFMLHRTVSLHQGAPGHPTGPVLRNHFILTALLFATALITHYEAAAVVPPAIYLLWLLVASGMALRTLVGHLALPASLLLVLTLSFYVPFFANPAFQETYARYSEKVIGESGFPFNHLAAFAARGMLYNSSVAFYLSALALVAGLLLLYWRRPHPVYRWLGGALAIGSLLLVLRPGLLAAGATDLTVWGVGLLCMAALCGPFATHSERMLWIWFVPPFFLSLFLLRDPNSHFYVFYTPWMLIAGLALADIWRWCQRRLGQPVAVAAGAGVAAVLILLFGFYAHSFFVRRDVEVVRNWSAQDVVPNWLVRTPTAGNPIFGVPHYSGWKVVGALYDAGVLQGTYTTNMRQWTGDWYTRGAVNCEHNPDFVILEPMERPEELAELIEQMGDEYALFANVEVGGEPRLQIYRRHYSGEPLVLPADDHDLHFDAALANAELPLVPPDVAPRVAETAYRFGDSLTLTGYGLHRAEAAPGGWLDLVLVWQVAAPVDADYTVFLQVLGPEARKIGQLDTLHDCNAGPTSTWDAGDTVVSRYRIPVFAGEEPGDYPLVVGLYEAQSYDRLPIFGADGAFLGDAIELAHVRILDADAHVATD